MQEALKEAEAAFRAGEVPVGAVVVFEGRIIGRGRNRMEELSDPSAHAEMMAINEARRNLKIKLLEGAELYCTLEPCPMCAGAAILHRVQRVIYGAPDLRWGGCGTIFNIPEEPRLNHRIEIIGGVMEEECRELLRRFFEQRRGIV